MTRSVLDRAWVPVDVLGGQVRIKVGSRDGRVVHATPEYEDAAELARTTGVPVAQVLVAAAAARSRPASCRGAPCPVAAPLGRQGAAICAARCPAP